MEVTRAIFWSLDFAFDEYQRTFRMSPESMACLLKGKVAKTSHSRGDSSLSVAINAAAGQLLLGHHGVEEDQAEIRRLDCISSLCDAVAYSMSPRQIFEVLKKTKSQAAGVPFDTYPHTLVCAAAVGDLGRVALMLLSNAPNEPMKSAFFGDARQNAARIGREDILKVLIEKGSNASCKDIAEAFTAACASGHASIVHFLLDSSPHLDANEKSINLDPEPAIKAAAYHGHTTLVQTLLQRFHLPNTHKTITQAALAASSRGHHLVIKMLLDNFSLDINLIDHQGQNLLHLAARGGHARTLQFLLDNRIQYYEGRWGDPLYLAAINGHQPAVSLLLNHGKSINDAQGTNQGLLAHAARNGEAAMIRYLVKERGFDLHDGSSNRGAIALEMAAERGEVETVKTLVELGVNVDGCPDDSEGRDAPVLRALMYGQVHVVDVLLSLGAKKVDPYKTVYADDFLDGEYPIRLQI